MTAAMMNDTIAASPRLLARVAGVFYLLVFIMGAGSLAFSSGIVVPGDAAATAANLLAKESVFRLSAASNLIATACYVVVTGLFYALFKPVNRTVSLIAAFFSLVGCAIGAVAMAFHFGAVSVLDGGVALNGFKADQLQGPVLLLLRLEAQTYNLGLVFFGVYCALIGWLILKSSLLPRILGALMLFAGIGWLTFLWPPLAKALYPYVLAPGLIGEGALTLWLLTAGVDARGWKEQTA